MQRLETILVAVRIRPLSQIERDQGLEPVVYATGKQELTDSNSKVYIYDRVFNEDVATQEVFDSVGEDIVLSALDGFSGCIFCYGQTGSGKTFTMHGNRGKNPGLVPLAVETIFSFIEEAEDKEFLIRCAYLEIYNESINDLLNSEATNLTLREDPLRSIGVQGLTETVCTSVEQIYSLLNLGDSNKQFAATKFNARSSRSHSILQVTIESKNRGDNRGLNLATLNMIDLAGSESALAHIASPAAASRQREMKCINRSLLTLSTVIQRLSEEAKTHIPYRDSKLTRLLRPALEGKAKVCVICNISPSPHSLEETNNTLKFAQRAKKVTQTLSKTEVIDSAVLLLQYEEEIKRLQLKLAEMETRIEQAPAKPHITEELQKQLEDKETENLKLDARLESLTEEKLALLEQLNHFKRFILDSETVKQSRESIVSPDYKWDDRRHGRQSIRMKEAVKGGRDSLEQPMLLADIEKVREILDADDPVERVSMPFAVAVGRQSLDLSEVVKEKDERIIELELLLKGKTVEVEELTDQLSMCRATIDRLKTENRTLKHQLSPR